MPEPFRVSWSDHAQDALEALIDATRKAEGNPAWVVQKFVECIQEGTRRLELFPDLRLRYLVDDVKCGALTLRTLPLQLFYRRVEPDEITIFSVRWAALDKTGPLEP